LSAIIANRGNNSNIPCSIISSLIPSILLLFELFEPAFELLDDVLEELGEEVDELLLLFEALELDALFVLLLLFELPFEDPEDPPDCFSFLSLIIIIYTDVAHLFIYLVFSTFAKKKLKFPVENTAVSHIVSKF
jgi:hypothetical protein